MKTVEEKDDMRSEYRREDLGKGMRGKYYEASLYTTKNSKILNYLT